MSEISDQRSSSSQAKELAVGTTFLEGRFHVIESVDNADFGVAWVAHDSTLHSDATLKYLLDCTLLSDTEISDFCEETKWNLFEEKPNIVRVFELRQPGSAANLIQELINLPSISQTSQPGHSIFDVQDIQDWIKLLCETLREVHHNGTAPLSDSHSSGHFNVKDNSRFEPDFSVSAPVNETVARLTGVPTIFTKAYGSPEQALGAPYGEKQDVYAIGALIYDLLTGRPPFFHGDILAQIQQASAPLMSNRRRNLGCKGALIPQRWEETVAACLAKNPADRPDLDELITMLFKEAGPIVTTKTKRNFPFAKIGMAAVGFFVLSGISVCSLRDKPETSPDPVVASLESKEIVETPRPEPVLKSAQEPEPKKEEPIPGPTPVVSSMIPREEIEEKILPTVAKPPKLAMVEKEQSLPFLRDFRLFARLMNPEPAPLSLASPEPEPEIVEMVKAGPPPEVKPEPVEPIVEAPPVQAPLSPVKEGESFTLESIGIEMIWVDPIASWVAKSEVTQEQFRRGGGSGYKKFKGDEQLAHDSITWHGAIEFCENLNKSEARENRLPSGFTYTLPTEDQWKIYVGDASLENSVYGGKSSTGPSRPGTKQANNFGLVDVRGNLWEWMLNDYKPGVPEKGKVLRGGSWMTSAKMIMDKNARFYGIEDNPYFQYGFRFVLTPIASDS